MDAYKNKERRLVGRKVTVDEKQLEDVPKFNYLRFMLNESDTNEAGC